MSQTVQQTWPEWAKEHYTAEGEARGAACGEARGKALGEVHGALRTCRADLRLMLEKRFGPLPEDLVHRIEASDDLARLQDAMRQLLHINSLRELQL